MVLNDSALEPRLQRALRLAAPALGLETSPSGVPVRACRVPKGLTLTRMADGWEIGCAQVSSFVRALSLLRQHCAEQEGFSVREEPEFSSFGVMVDCSRNAVPTADALRRMLVRLALMGYNCVQLYTEDVFELEGYPYFGYLRGRYTRGELRELDDFAASLGIEMVPCIQTLAHLRRALQWDAFEDMHDCNDILLCAEEKTYRWIEAMFAAVSEVFRSRRVNIGMDEAHMLGLGKYLDRHGFEDRFGIMLRHLDRVMEIARRYGYSPMMWSDMFFRLANGGEYYAADSAVDPALRSRIPEDVTLVYWDYYSADKAVYDKMLRRHRELCGRTAFAGGAWKWIGFTPENGFSMEIAELAAASCAENGVEEVLVTCWGDDGAEASLFSVLPALCCWAELCWAHGGGQRLKERFAVCCGADFDDMMRMDEPAQLFERPAPATHCASAVKYYFYQDALLGLADYLRPGEREARHFARCAVRLHEAAERNPKYAAMLEAQAALCEALELKAPFGASLREAYRSGDREALRRLAAETAPELERRIEAFRRAYHRQWLSENKPFGLEVIDIRIGGVAARVRTAAERVQDYLSGAIGSIEELDAELLPFSERRGPDRAMPPVCWDRMVSPSGIGGV